MCWDVAAELWMNIPEFGDATLWPKTGPNQYAMECWTVSRDQNAGNSFTLINRKEDIKRGDVIVIGPSVISSTGHIAFADIDYVSGNTLPLLGQNQVDPSLVYGHIPTVTNIDISAFLGAFRYNDWVAPEPPTPSSRRANKFPWVLYARKLRSLR